MAANCFPTGMLGYWVRRLADGGLAAALTATSPPRLAHPDGGDPLVGTTPLAIAVPSSDGRPLVADVSMGKVTHGDVIAGHADAADLVPFGGEQAHKAFALAAGLAAARRGARRGDARRAARRRAAGGRSGAGVPRARGRAQASRGTPEQRREVCRPSRRTRGDSGSSSSARRDVRLASSLWPARRSNAGEVVEPGAATRRTGRAPSCMIASASSCLPASESGSASKTPLPAGGLERLVRPAADRRARSCPPPATAPSEDVRVGR